MYAAVLYRRRIIYVKEEEEEEKVFSALFLFSSLDFLRASDAFGIRDTMKYIYSHGYTKQQLLCCALAIYDDVSAERTQERK